MATAGDFASLLPQLTVPEKAAFLDGSDFWRTTPVERLGIPAVMFTDGPHGLRKQNRWTASSTKVQWPVQLRLRGGVT